MKAYASVIRVWFRASLMKQMEYHFDFIAGGAFELMWTVMYVLFIDVLFMQTESINGWSRYQMLLLTFQGGLMDSLFTFCIVPGLKRLPEIIHTGNLDFILLKPLNERFYISLNEFDLPQLKNVLLNVAGLFWCMKKLNIALSPVQALIYTALSINGFFLIYSIMFMLMSAAFWLVRMDIVMGIGSELISIGNKPMSIYPAFLQKLLIYAVPVLVCFNFPILYMLGNLELRHVLYSFFAGAAIHGISNEVFRRGLRKYAGTGS